MMPLSIGQPLPDVPVVVVTDDGPEEQDRGAFFGGKKTVLFAVPGAFTPTCNNNHLPGYVQHADAFRARGIDQIAVLAVNDHHVMKVWRETNGGGDIQFLADGSALFTQAADMVLDATGAGLGIRSLRYAALVDDGVVTKLAVEESPGQAEASSAQAMLAMIDED